MTSTVAAKVLHRHGGLPMHGHEAAGDRETEFQERAVVVHQLASNHPSGMGYQVTVEHPEWCHHPFGPLPKSRQAPEITRWRTEAEANAYAHVLIKALGGEPDPDLLPAPAATAEGGGLTREDLQNAIERATAPLLRRIKQLEG